MARIYVAPAFNVTIDVWRLGHNPSTDPPDIVNQACQIYTNSRDPMKLWHDNVPTEVFPIILRLPLVLAWTPATTDVWRRSVIAGPYHKILWLVPMHPGFPNEYLAAYSSRCDAGRNLLSPA